MAPPEHDASATEVADHLQANAKPPVPRAPSSPSSTRSARSSASCPPMRSANSPRIVHRLILPHGHYTSPNLAKRSIRTLALPDDSGRHRGQLIITSRSTASSPSSNQRTVTPPGLRVEPPSSGSETNEMGVATVCRSADYVDGESVSRCNSTNQLNTCSGEATPPTATISYDNMAFDNSEELILNPRNLWSHGGEVDPAEDESFMEDMVVIERPIYSQKDFDQGFEGGQRPKRTACTWIKSKARKCEFSLACVRKTIAHHLPFLSIMREYNLRTDLIADVIAGLTVGIMHIPQGMAYGQLSTLPPVFGLYVSFFPVILYFFLGSSKHVSIGTFAVISLMVGSAVDKGLKDRNMVPNQWNQTLEVDGNMTSKMMDNSEELLQTKLMLAMSVTFVVGAIQLLLGFFQLGFLTVYLSDPLISGFTTGAAVHVFTSQIKHIFGIPTGRYSGAFKLVYVYRDIFINLPQTKPVTFIASIVCMVLLVVVKEYINSNPKIKPRLLMPIPIELIVVALGTVISYFVELEETYGVKVVGDIPIGIPAPTLNAFPYITEVIADAIAIAIVSFAISVSMAKIFAKKHDYTVDSNQELLAYGACNVMSSFFSSFVSAVSLSRSLVQEDVGGKTQVTGLVSSGLLLIVLLVVGPYFRTLPDCVLAAIILVALKGMFKQFGDLKTLWGISLIDFATWLITFSATVFLDVDLGLLVGVVFALLTVIMKSQRPYACLLGQVPGTDIYKDVDVYKVAEEIPNIKIFRFDCALFFANSEYFKSSLYKLTVDPYNLKKIQRKLNKKKKKEDHQLLNITVDSMGSADIQTTEADDEADDEADVDKQVPGPNTNTNITSAMKQCEGDTRAIKDPNFMTQVPTLTDVHYIVIDCSTMSYVDSMGVKVLQQVISELRAFNITVYLAQCKSSVREMFECTNFYKTGSKNYMFLTIHDAVVSAQLHQWSVTGENPSQNGNNNNTSNSSSKEADLNDDGGKGVEFSEDVLESNGGSVIPRADNHGSIVLERTPV